MDARLFPIWGRGVHDRAFAEKIIAVPANVENLNSLSQASLSEAFHLSPKITFKMSRDVGGFVRSAPTLYAQLFRWLAGVSFFTVSMLVLDKKRAGRAALKSLCRCLRY